MEQKISQLSVITDEISQNLDEALQICEKFGITTIDLRNVWGKNIVDFNDDDLNRIKIVLQKYHMNVGVITGPLFKCYLESSWLNSRTSSSYSKYIADFFKTKYIRGFGFFKDGLSNKKKWKELLDNYHLAAKLAREKGKEILVENEHITYLDSLKHTQRFFEELNEPNVHCILDPGNFFSGGELLKPKDYEGIFKFVKHVHVKDASKRIPLVVAFFGVVGEGKLDYKGLFEFFNSKGYKGKYVLETHALKDRKEISIKSLENMKSWLEN